MECISGQHRMVGSCMQQRAAQAAGLHGCTFGRQGLAMQPAHLQGAHTALPSTKAIAHVSSSGAMRGM